MSIDIFAHLNSSVASACLILDLILAALYYGKILVDLLSHSVSYHPTIFQNVSKIHDFRSQNSEGILAAQYKNI